MFLVVNDEENKEGNQVNEGQTKGGNGEYNADLSLTKNRVMAVTLNGWEKNGRG